MLLGTGVLGFAIIVFVVLLFAPDVYTSKSVCFAYDWSAVVKMSPLWVAQYPNYEETGLNQKGLSSLVRIRVSEPKEGLDHAFPSCHA